MGQGIMLSNSIRSVLTNSWTIHCEDLTPKLILSPVEHQRCLLVSWVTSQIRKVPWRHIVATCVVDSFFCLSGIANVIAVPMLTGAAIHTLATRGRQCAQWLSIFKTQRPSVTEASTSSGHQAAPRRGVREQHAGGPAHLQPGEAALHHRQRDPEAGPEVRTHKLMQHAYGCTRTHTHTGTHIVQGRTHANMDANAYTRILGRTSTWMHKPHPHGCEHTHTHTRARKVRTHKCTCAQTHTNAHVDDDTQTRSKASTWKCVGVCTCLTL